MSSIQLLDKTRKINKLLHNAWIDYRYDNGSDEDYLDGNLSDYITQ